LGDELLAHRGDLDVQVLFGQIEVRGEELARVALPVPGDGERPRLVLPRDPVEVQQECELSFAVVSELDLFGAGSFFDAQLAPAWTLGMAGSAAWCSSGNSSWMAPATSSWTGPTAMPNTPWPRRSTSITSSALVAASVVRPSESNVTSVSGWSLASCSLRISTAERIFFSDIPASSSCLMTLSWTTSVNE